MQLKKAVAGISSIIEGLVGTIRSSEEVFKYNRPAYLVMIFSGVSEYPETGRRFEFKQEEDEEPKEKWSIGSDIKDEIQLATEAAFPHHAQICRIKGDKWELSNTASKKEIYANNLLVSTHLLRDGDIIAIGKAIFKFFSGTGANAIYDNTMYERAMIDALTGIYDRGFFDQSIIREFKRCHRQEQPISLLIMDLDKFKDVNTKYGLQGGDEVLRQVTRKVKSRVREDEVFARYGGEELALILPGANLDQASDFAEQMRQLVSNTTILFKEQIIQVTVSIGVSSLSVEQMKLGLDQQELLARSSACMKEAKDTGRNRIVLWKEDTHKMKEFIEEQ